MHSRSQSDNVSTMRCVLHPDSLSVHLKAGCPVFPKVVWQAVLLCADRHLNRLRLSQDRYPKDRVRGQLPPPLHQ